MPEVYRGTLYVTHHSLGLGEAETHGYTDGEEIFGDPNRHVHFKVREARVITENDDVEVVIYRGRDEKEGILVGAGTIDIGGLGLEVGNFGLSDADQLDWPAGKTAVKVYLNTPVAYEATRVTFVLEPLDVPATPAELEAAARQVTGTEAVDEEVERVLAKFGSQHLDKRLLAASRLGRLGSPALPPLIAALRDSRSGVRQMAASALGDIGSPEAVEPLLPLLRDEAAEGRQYAATALGQIGDPRATEPLIAALQDPETGVRWRVALAQGQIGDPQAVEPLAAMLQKRDGITDLIPRFQRSPEQALSALFDLLNQPQVLAGFAGLGPDVADRQQAMNDLSDLLGGDMEDLMVREAAAVALGDIGDERGIPALLRAYQEPNDHLRYMVQKAFWHFGEKAVAPLTRIADQDPDSATRQAARQALGQLKQG